jgi:hypothetical protein
MAEEMKYILPNGKVIPINHNEPLNKIPKGFITEDMLLSPEYCMNEDFFFLPKSIYDRRIDLVENCLLFHDGGNMTWDDCQKEIMTILNGEIDDE